MVDPFLDLRSYSTVLLIAAVDRYGLDVLQWLPETIEMELAIDCHAPVPPDNLAKLFVASRLLTSDEFFNSPSAFCATCATLAGHPPSDGRLIIPDTDDAAWGITEAMLLANPEGDSPFSAEIVAMLGHILDQEGMLVPPSVLRVAVRDKDLAGQVNHDFSDDPVMYRAIFERDRSRADDIDDLVASRSRGLFEQLSRLTLKTADADRVRNLCKKMAGALPPGEAVGLVPN